MTQIKHPFETSTRTVDEYKRSITEDMTFEEHAQWLLETIAESTCGFIVRRERRSSFYYQEIDDRTFSKMLNKKLTVYKKVTTLDSKGCTVTKETPYVKHIVDLVNDPSLGVKLMYYDGMELYSADPHILSRYVPPQIPSDSSVDELAIKVIDFMRSRVKNPRAFDEEISSHAYRLRYPETFIEKCFVHYSKEGSTGKSFLAGLLSMMYPKLANINVHHNQLTEK